MVTEGADPHGVLPLVRVVREKVNGSGMSLRVFAAERRIAYSTLRRYYDKNLSPLSQPPRTDTLRELSLALDLPLGEVEQLALESLSYRQPAPAIDPRPTSPDVIDVSSLTPIQRRAIDAVLHAFGSTDAPAKTEAATRAAHVNDARGRTAEEVRGLADGLLPDKPPARRNGDSK